MALRKIMRKRFLGVKRRIGATSEVRGAKKS
jgi:hypothetical protein